MKEKNNKNKFIHNKIKFWFIATGIRFGKLN